MARTEREMVCTVWRDGKTDLYALERRRNIWVLDEDLPTTSSLGLRARSFHQCFEEPINTL